MESGPPKIAEVVVYWLIPPACREEVLGDMRERNPGIAHYLAEATSTVPSVIYSRIRRTMDAVVTLMAALSMYTAFVMSERWLDPSLLFCDYGLARLATPPAILLAVVILVDAYSNPKKRGLLKPLFGPALGLVFAYSIELSQRFALPEPVMAWGGTMSLLLVSTLRLIFAPPAERPQIAKIPAFWQKLELLPLPFTLKNALVPGAILLAILIGLLILHA
jgi:hypothetical protein